MPTRWVLEHDCRSSPETDSREGGVPFRRYKPPKQRKPHDDGIKFTCDCERRITTRDAREKVELRVAVWKLRWVGDHRPPIEDHSEIILLKIAHPTSARMITENDIIETVRDDRSAAARRLEMFRP